MFVTFYAPPPKKKKKKKVAVGVGLVKINKDLQKQGSWILMIKKMFEFYYVGQTQLFEAYKNSSKPPQINPRVTAKH